MSMLRNIFSSPEAPRAPDPSALAASQGAANADTARTTARLNRINTYTPFGSVTYDDMGNDQWKSTQTLSPGMQGMLDQSINIGSGVNDAALSRIGNLDNSAFSLDGVPAFQSGIDMGGLAALPNMEDLNSYAGRAEDAAYSKAMNRLNPEFDRSRESLESRLANQGITMGSDAYGTEMERFTNRVDDAREQAAYGAVREGSALRSSLLADALTGRQQGLSERYTAMDAANQGRGQAINDRILERTQGLNELAALLQGQQAIQGPSASAPGQVGVAPPDIMGANAMAMNAQNNQYNAQMGQQGAALGGLFGLGGGALAGGYF